MGQGKTNFDFIKRRKKRFLFLLAAYRLLLAKDGHVGMSQAVFEGLFKRKVVGDTVQLGGYRESEFYTITFAKQTLTRIAYEHQLD
jgi:hypothetical protein